jgi:hypothetical protein
MEDKQFERKVDLPACETGIPVLEADNDNNSSLHSDENRQEWALNFKLGLYESTTDSQGNTQDVPSCKYDPFENVVKDSRIVVDSSIEFVEVSDRSSVNLPDAAEEPNTNDNNMLSVNAVSTEAATNGYEKPKMNLEHIGSADLMTSMDDFLIVHIEDGDNLSGIKIISC